MNKENNQPVEGLSNNASAGASPTYAVAYYTLKNQLELREKALSEKSANVCPAIYDLARYCLENKHFTEARDYVNRLLELAKEHDLFDFIKASEKLIIDIDIVNYLRCFLVYNSY
jgi:hypothetical protein